MNTIPKHVMKAARIMAKKFAHSDIPLLNRDDNLQDCICYYLEQNIPDTENDSFYYSLFKNYLMDKVKREQYRTHEELFLETFNCQKNEAVIMLINKLPEKQRAVIEMTFWGRMTTAEIATELTVSIRTVKRLRKRAYQSMKNYLTT